MVVKPRNDVNLTDIGPYTDGTPQYITAAWDNSSEIPSQFTVGDETITVANGIGYYNAPLNLEKGYGFLVKVQVASDNGEALTTYSNIITVSVRTSFLREGIAIGVALIVVGITLTIMW